MLCLVKIPLCCHNESAKKPLDCRLFGEGRTYEGMLHAVNFLINDTDSCLSLLDILDDKRPGPELYSGHRHAAIGRLVFSRGMGKQRQGVI
jgi:hypothetical protein